MNIIVKYQLLLSILSGWAVAQILKALINMIATRKFDPERLIGTGGMPSSHSATVSALCTGALLIYGLSSFEFAASFVLMMIVMVDAMGVRLETGKQAKLLNLMLELNDDLTKLLPQKRFKELVGHTMLQVVIGMLVGILTALIINAIA